MSWLRRSFVKPDAEATSLGRAFNWPGLAVVQLLVGLATLALLAGCRRRAAAPLPATTAVITVAVVPARAELAPGETLQLSPTLVDAAGNRVLWRPTIPTLVKSANGQVTPVIGRSLGRTGRIVVWRSSDSTVARVDEHGAVTGLRPGLATIGALSQGHAGTAEITVIDSVPAPLAVAPLAATFSVGQSLQLSAITPPEAGRQAAQSIMWRSDRPSLATVDRSGRVSAVAPGAVTITVLQGQSRASASLTIAPARIISGLDFPGSAGVTRTMRFEFTRPLRAFPATYIWRAYPRQQDSYYTAFFWGNLGTFFGSRTYYGFHPYPDWRTRHQHLWEIAAPPGRDFVSGIHVVYDRWYVQVAICRQDTLGTAITYYWDWPDTTRVVRHVGAVFPDPPTPGLIVGDAPWNPGNEVWNGVLRGFQFYDVALTRTEIAREIASPGSFRAPWYLNLNPTPADIGDHSGYGHDPRWVGAERPAGWFGIVNAAGAIRTTVPPP